MSFPAYPEYKNSGVPWLGEVPRHWRTERLKALFELQKRPVRPEDEIVTAFRDGTVTLRKNRREDGFTNALQEIGYQGIRRGDLVIHAMDGFAGAIGVSDADGKSTPVYSVCRPKAGTSAHYYGRLLRHMALSGFVNALARGVRERSTEFRWGDASILHLPVPPKDEQIAINAFLDRETAKIDALVAEQERLIALLKEKRQAVISHAVTKGLNPHAPMKDSGIEWLGEIPAHWEVGKLKRYLAQVDYGISDSLDTVGAVAILRMGNIQSGRVVLDDLKYVASVDQELLLREGDLLFNRTNSLDQIAKVGLVLELPDAPLSFASYLVRMRPTTHANAKFLSFLMNTEGLLGVARSRAFVAIGQCNLNPTRYGEIDVCMPVVDEQENIVAHLEPICGQLDHAVSECEAAITLLQERRAALISAAVTGKIDVRGLVDQQELEAA